MQTIHHIDLYVKEKINSPLLIYRNFVNGHDPTMLFYSMNLVLSNTMGAISGAGVAYPSRAPELTLVFVGFVLLQL